MRRQDHLRAIRDEVAQQAQQGEAAREREGGFRFVEDPQTLEVQSFPDEVQEGLPVAALMEGRADPDVLEVRVEAVHRLGAKEEPAPRRPRASDQLQVVGQRRLGRAGDIHRPGRSALGVHPVGHRDRLHEGGLADAVASDETRAADRERAVQLGESGGSVGPVERDVDERDGGSGDGHGETFRGDVGGRAPGCPDAG